MNFELFLKGVNKQEVRTLIDNQTKMFVDEHFISLKEICVAFKLNLDVYPKYNSDYWSKFPLNQYGWRIKDIKNCTLEYRKTGIVMILPMPEELNDPVN